MPEEFDPNGYELNDFTGPSPAQLRARRGPKPTWKRGLEAAFRLDNTVGSTVNFLATEFDRAEIRQRVGVDPKYDAYDDIWGTEFENDHRAFRESGSPEETRRIMQKLRLQKDDERVLDDAGPASFLYRTGANVLDLPTLTVLIPGGQGRGLASVLRGALTEGSVAAASESLLSFEQNRREGQVQSVLLSAGTGGLFSLGGGKGRVGRSSMDAAPRGPGARMPDDVLLAEAPAAMRLSDAERGARMANPQGRPAFQSAGQALAGGDPKAALGAAVRATTVDLAAETRAPKAPPIVQDKAAATLRLLGADPEGGLSHSALDDVLADLETLRTTPKALPPARRTALERVTASIASMRVEMARRGQVVGPGGKAATDGFLTPPDRIRIAWSEVLDKGRAPVAPAPATATPGVVRPSPDLAPEALSQADARIRASSLDPETARIAAGVDQLLPAADGPAAMAKLEAARGRVIAEVDPGVPPPSTPDLATLRRLAADPAHGPVVEATAWSLGSSEFGEALGDGLAGLIRHPARGGLSQGDAQAFVRALDDSLASGEGSLAGWRATRGPADGVQAAWARDSLRIVQSVVDDRLTRALLDAADGAPLDAAQRARLANYGLGGDTGVRAAAEIRRFVLPTLRSADDLQLGPSLWKDRQAAMAVERALKAETRSALDSGPAADVWKVRALVDLLDAGGELLGELTDGALAKWGPGASWEAVKTVTQTGVKGALSDMLNSLESEPDDDGPEDDDGAPTPDRRAADEALRRALGRSGLIGWLMDTRPPLEPELMAPGLDGPVGRLLTNLTVLRMLVGDQPEADAADLFEAPPKDDAGDEARSPMLVRAAWSGEAEDGPFDGVLDFFQPWRKEERRLEALEDARLDREEREARAAIAKLLKGPDIEEPYIKRWENGLTNGVPNPPKTVGYVPSIGSGVTIGTGVDIGQKGLKELQALKLEPALFDKLKPYVGAKGAAARALLKAKPLRLTPEEAEAVTKASHAWELKQLQAAFNGDTKIGRFQDMPTDAQTVLFSLYLQHGTSNPKATAPRLWQAATTGDWASVENELRYGFPNDLPKDRRKADADKIRAAINAGRLRLKPGTRLKPLPPETPKPGAKGAAAKAT